MKTKGDTQTRKRITLTIIEEDLSDDESCGPDVVKRREVFERSEEGEGPELASLLREYFSAQACVYDFSIPLVQVAELVDQLWNFDESDQEANDAFCFKEWNAMKDAAAKFLHKGKASGVF